MVELVQSFKENKGSFYVGSGLSQAVGLPSWEGLLKEFIEHFKVILKPSGKELKDYEQMLKDPSKYLLLAEALKEKLGSFELENILRRRFFDKRPDPAESHKIIIELLIAIIIFTTNFYSL